MYTDCGAYIFIVCFYIVNVQLKYFEFYASNNKDILLSKHLTSFFVKHIGIESGNW